MLVKGTCSYLIVMIDICSRKIVGGEAFLAESGDNACGVLKLAVLAERTVLQSLVLHAVNGSPFKVAKLLENLRDVQIEPSFSWQRVSNDNPYSEAFFRTCEYVPDYPVKGLETWPAARQ